MATIEENATIGADWETNLQNKPTILQTLADAFDVAGVTGVTIDKNGNHLELEFEDEAGAKEIKNITLI